MVDDHRDLRIDRPRRPVQVRPGLRVGPGRAPESPLRLWFVGTDGTLNTMINNSILAAAPEALTLPIGTLCVRTDDMCKHAPVVATPDFLLPEPGMFVLDTGLADHPF